MSGHSKWKTIQHKKGAADAKRGKIFSRMSKELMMLAKAGGGSPDTNAALRTTIAKARASNMPMDNIERAIKKGTGELEGATLEEIIYEGFAEGGVGLVVKILTDNKNRAAAEIRHVFTRNNSSFAAQGSVSRGFRRRGQIYVAVAGADEEKLMNTALEAGAEDMRQDGDNFEILTEPGVFPMVMEALEKAGFKTEDSEVRFVPDTYVPVTEPSVAKAVMRFVEALEENDDVQDVYTNMDMDDSLLAKLE
jgi:YebC/PmpR family DNA-binding regulatory protein